MGDHRIDTSADDGNPLRALRIGPTHAATGRKFACQDQRLLVGGDSQGPLLKALIALPIFLTIADPHSSNVNYRTEVIPGVVAAHHSETYVEFWE